MKTSIIVVTLLIVKPLVAAPTCHSDSDCPGELLCQAGECWPEGAPPPPRPQPQPQPFALGVGPTLPRLTNDPGWSMGAGVYGIIASTLFMGLAIGSEVTRDHQVPSLPLGSMATLVHIASVPIVAAGGASARRGGGRGVLGLRVAGWVLYGLTLVDACALIALGVMKQEPPAGVISAAGVLGMTSGVFMSVDALVAHAQAGDHGRREGAARVAPSFAVTRDGGVVGVVGTF
jgi:hypothetical protein